MFFRWKSEENVEGEPFRNKEVESFRMYTQILHKSYLLRKSDHGHTRARSEHPKDSEPGRNPGMLRVYI